MIRFINVTHYAGEKELYSGLNWHVKPGERIGLVGDNGTGKTTLLRMASGDIESVSGTVSVRKGARVGFLRQEINAAEGDTTVLQEVMRAFEVEKAAAAELEELYGKFAELPEDQYDELYERIHELEKHVKHHDFGSAEADAKKILVGLGFTFEQIEEPLSKFSGGWQMRAHIARLLLEDPDLLMLDEPTNHLDLESIRWLEEFLLSFQGAVIVVSHDRYFLDKMTTRTAWVHERRLDTYSCNYSEFLKERELHEEMLMRRYKNQQEELAHHQEFIDRFRSKASKATLVQSRIKLVEKIEIIELPQTAKKVRLRIPPASPVGRNVMELRGVHKSYGDNHVLRGLNLRVSAGDKIALVGRNGAGKSTLLKILANQLDYTGEKEVHPKVQIEYFSQHRVDSLHMENEVLKEARPDGIDMTDEQIRSLLGCFLFTGDDVFKKVGVLSGGEKSRLALARMMMSKANLLLLDEPTNHLDISTREVLQQALRDFDGTVVFVSHDRYFIDGFATQVAEIANGVSTIFHGNYTGYMAQKKDMEDAEADLRGRAGAGKPTVQVSGAALAQVSAEKAEAALKVVKSLQKDSKSFSPEEKRQRAEKRNALYQDLRKIEKVIEENESRIAELNTLQADPDAWAKGLVNTEHAKEAKDREAKLATVMVQWEKLSSEIEELKTN